MDGQTDGRHTTMDSIHFFKLGHMMSQQLQTQPRCSCNPICTHVKTPSKPKSTLKVAGKWHFTILPTLQVAKLHQSLQPLQSCHPHVSCRPLVGGMVVAPYVHTICGRVGCRPFFAFHFTTQRSCVKSVLHCSAGSSPAAHAWVTWA